MILFKLNTSNSIMRPISTVQRDNILSLLASGHSSGDIAKRTGICKSKVYKLAKEYQPDKENLKGGCPKKLTSRDDKAIISLINTGRASTAVQAAKHINSIINNLVSTQTVRNILQHDKFKSYTSPISLLNTGKLDWPLLRSMETGQ